ncbi:MAG: cyclodeaminase/cyclohydrolase family protein [Synergistaceae bacterium]|nr:cyclodeaminase/cyclohydrolase family protein [Synergistaceae bacterium]
MAFKDIAIKSFGDQLAAGTATPGGGSSAALCASMGAGLVSMVANLTVGRERYKDSQPVMEETLRKSELLRVKFMELIDEDVAAFNNYMDALRLPKGTGEEKEARRMAMSDASKVTASVPLRMLEACADLAELAVVAAKFGNRSAASDAGVAALLAEAVGRAAAYNVRVNLPGIDDENFAAELKRKTETLLGGISRYASETAVIMEEVLG